MFFFLASNCGSIVHGPSGTVQSSNFPNNYPNNEYCTWEIRVPQGKKVRIDFEEFRTEEGKDKLFIYDTGSVMPMIVFSGIKDKPRALTSSGNSLRVRFVSDGANVNNGFKLSYKQTGRINICRHSFVFFKTTRGSNELLIVTFRVP